VNFASASVNVARTIADADKPRQIIIFPWCVSIYPGQIRYLSVARSDFTFVGFDLSMVDWRLTNAVSVPTVGDSDVTVVGFDLTTVLSGLNAVHPASKWVHRDFTSADSDFTTVNLVFTVVSLDLPMVDWLSAKVVFVSTMGGSNVTAVGFDSTMVHSAST